MIEPELRITLNGVITHMGYKSLAVSDIFIRQ